MTTPINVNKQEQSGLDLTPEQHMVDSNMDGENKATTSAILNDIVHEDTVQHDDGMEWSEVDNLNIGSSDSGQKGPQASSQASSELHDYPLATDVHRLVDVINSVIRSKSKCSKLHKQYQMNWSSLASKISDNRRRVRSFGAQELIEESMNSLALDTVNDTPHHNNEPP